MISSFALAVLLAAPGPIVGPPLPAIADDPPVPYNTEHAEGGPLDPEEAVRSFRMPPGFLVSVFAAEPDVRNPIAMAWDARGRLWVAENDTYAERGVRFDLALRDRVTIFEDADGDGRFDRRSVFTEDARRLTGLELGRGGAWLACPPQILFVPDRDGDDRPDGPPEVVLDGFTVPAENYHTVVNGLRWGPDGWLYGRCGASSAGLVGPPGTPVEHRVPIRGGLWRYHPARRTFEVLSHGTTNPWGHDWDEAGNAFFINTVNGHLWHAIPGAHFARSHTIDPNPHVYEPIDQHADHVHWDDAAGVAYTDGLARAEDDRWGGGHAHSGLMLYRGGQWPSEYHGALMTLNFHGRRINVDRLQRDGSGFVGRHAPDAFVSADSWFRGIDLSYGPDGSVFVLDWSDTGDCHEHNGVHRSSGRIYEIAFGDPKPAGRDDFDLERSGADRLAILHEHPNAWFTRQSRRVLADRAARGEPIDDAVAILHEWLDGPGSPERRLRSLWTLFAVSSLDEPSLVALLDDGDEAIRAAAIRLLTDDLPIDDVMSHRPGPDRSLSPERIAMLARIAESDPSGLVRLALASTLQRLPVDQRLALAAPLLSRSEDSGDHNLPLLIWYGLIPLADTDPEALARLAIDCRLPTTRRLIARRLAEQLESKTDAVGLLLDALASTSSVELAADLLDGLAEGTRGRRQAPRPEGWAAVASRWGAADHGDIRDRVRALSVLFGDGLALDELRRLALDPEAALDARRAALRTLIENRPDDLRSICERLLSVRFLNSTAVRGLSLFDDPELGRSLARNYRTFHPTERSTVIETLASRPSFAHAMLDRMAEGGIPREDLSPFLARQVRGFDDPELERKLEESWGLLRESDEEKRAIIARFKDRLAPEVIAEADPGKGRFLYDRVCASCHRLFGEGGAIGPDLTGAGRDDLDYLLENIVDPSARVDADYRVAAVALDDGRVLNGVVRSRTEQTLTLQTPEEVLSLELAAVEEIRPSDSSLMPDGLLDPLGDDEVRDLIAYLMRGTQAPRPPGDHAVPRGPTDPEAPGGTIPSEN